MSSLRVCLRWGAAMLVALVALGLLRPAAAQEAARPAGRILVPRDADLWAVLTASGASSTWRAAPTRG
jgi:hypothetical protein